MSQQIQISEFISCTINYRIIKEEILLESGKEIVGEIEINFNYTCDKVFGKCFDDFIIYPEVEDVNINIELSDGPYATGKLSAKALDNKIEAKVSRGSGTGNLKTKYKIIVNPKSEGKITAKIYFILERKDIEKKRVGSPIELNVEILKALKDISFIVMTKTEEYVIGDDIRIKLKIDSKYKGKAMVVFSGAVKDKKCELNLKTEELNEYEDVLKIANTDKDYIEACIKIPEIGLSTKKTLKIVVIPHKTTAEIENIPKETFIGESFVVDIKLMNNSHITTSLAMIKLKVYEYEIKRELELKPKESRIEPFYIPPPTFKSSNITSGHIEVIDLIEPKSRFYKEITLPKPLPPKVDIKLSKSELLIPSFYASEAPREECTVKLDVNNYMNTELRLVILEYKSELCNVNPIRNELLVESMSYRYTFLHVIPIKIGKKKVGITLKLYIKELLIYEYNLMFSVEIYPSFNITGLSILEPKSPNVLRGQKVSFLLNIKSKVNKLFKIWLNSSTLRFDTNELFLKTGENSYNIYGWAKDYGDVLLEITDGSHTEKVNLPLKISKPNVNIDVKKTTFYTAVKQWLTINITNIHDDNLELTVNVKSKDKKIEIIDKHFTMNLKPLEEKLLRICVIGLEENRKNILLHVITKYLEDTSEIIKEIPIDFLGFPIKIEVKNKTPNKIFIPEPVKTLFINYNLYTSLLIDVIVKNLVDTFIENVSLRIFTEKQDIIITQDLKEAFLDANSSTTIKVHVKVPFNYMDKYLTLKYSVKIAAEYLVENELDKIPVERYSYFIVSYLKKDFNRNICIYPFIDSEEEVIAFIPLTSEPNEYGKPVELSFSRFKLYRFLQETLRKEKYEDNVWDIAALAILKKNIESRPDLSKELNFAKNMEVYIGDLVLVPALLWKETLNRIITSKRAFTQLADTMDNVGIVIINDKTEICKTKGKLYRDLIRFIMSEDPANKNMLINYIQTSIDNLIIEPLFLLYQLNGGDPLNFSKDIMDKLINSSRYYELLIYLALTIKNNTGWFTSIENIEHLIKILMSNRSIIKKKSAKLALSIILTKINDFIEDQIKNVIEVKK